MFLPLPSGMHDCIFSSKVVCFGSVLQLKRAIVSLLERVYQNIFKFISEHPLLVNNWVKSYHIKQSNPSIITYYHYLGHIKQWPLVAKWYPNSVFHSVEVLCRHTHPEHDFMTHRDLYSATGLLDSTQC